MLKYSWGEYNYEVKQKAPVFNFKLTIIKHTNTLDKTLSLMKGAYLWYFVLDLLCIHSLWEAKQRQENSKQCWSKDNLVQKHLLQCISSRLCWTNQPVQTNIPCPQNRALEKLTIYHQSYDIVCLYLISYREKESNSSHSSSPSYIIALQLPLFYQCLSNHVAKSTHEAWKHKLFEYTQSVRTPYTTSFYVKTCQWYRLASEVA